MSYDLPHIMVMTSERSGSGYHTGAVNVLLLECGIAQVGETVENVQKEIVQQREQHSAVRAVEWLKGYQGEVWTDADVREFYNPRTYVCWGGFDVATVFLSPTLHLPVLFRSGATSESGQHLHRGILPKKPDELPGAVDFNERYLEKLRERIRRGDQGLAHEPDHRFFAFTKLKLSGSVVLPQEGASTCRFKEAFVQTWRCVHDWLAEESNGAGSVALCQSFGWSELMLLAHGASLTTLFALVADLRKQVGEPAWNPSEQSHQFVTSVTKMAFDSRLWTRAHDCMKEPQVTLDEHGRIPAAHLVTWSREIVEGLDEDPRLGEPHTYLRPMFCAYPGHESRIWQRIAQLQAAVREAEGTPDRLPPGTIVSAGDGGVATYVDAQLGTRDVVGPTIQPSAEFSETGATALQCLIQHWILRDGWPLGEREGNLAGDGDGGPDPAGRRRGVLNIISCVTIVGVQIAWDKADAEAWRFPPRHTLETPAEGLLSPERRNLKMYKQLAGLIEPMRLLQIPYSRIDQILNVCRNFLWSRRHEVLWEDTLDFESALLCMADHVLEIARWWRSGAEPPVSEAWRYNASGTNEQALKQSARRRLERLRREIDAVLAAFSSSFYNRHLTGYMADETADVNLGYRGSIHQLVNVTSILLDAVATIVLGRRACLVTVADTVSPQIDGPCDVLVAQVSAETVTHPFLLDTIGHEVGHWLAVELLQGDDPVHLHRGARGAKDSDTYRELQARFNELQDNVFFGELGRESDFCELIADVTELMLLDPDDRQRWTKSFLIRQLFEAPTVDGPVDDRLDPETASKALPEEERDARHILGPAEDEAIMAATVERACHVWIALTALDLPARSTDPGFLEGAAWIALKKLRELLYAECLIGQSEFLFQILSNRREWEKFVREHVFRAPWLANSYARARTWECLRALRSHLGERERGLEGLDRTLWDEAKRQLLALRTVTVDVVRPAIYLRHSLPDTELMESPGTLRAKLLETRGEDRLPWKATPQPFSLAEKHFETRQRGRTGARLLHRSPPRMLFYQRGAMLPLTQDASTELFNANAEFIGGMMQLVPVWKGRLTRGRP